MSGVRLHRVPPDNVGFFWPDIAIYIEEACQKGPGSIHASELKSGCENGAFQLWMVQRGHSHVCAVVTGVLVEPYRSVLEVIAVGGRDMSDWLGLETELAEKAKREMGVEAVRTMCRPGFMRKMQPRGYRIKGYVMERAL